MPLRKFFALLCCFIVAQPQIIRPLSHKQTSLLAGTAVATFVGYCHYQWYKNKYQENVDYSQGKNIFQSCALGLVTGGLFGWGLHTVIKKTQNVGADNVGNSNKSVSDCFMNASYQALYHTPAFRKFIDETPNGESEALDLIRDHFTKMDTATEPVDIYDDEQSLRPKMCDLLKRPEMKEGQHCAREFLTEVLEKIDTDLQKNKTLHKKFEQLCESPNTGAFRKIVTVSTPTNNTKLINCLENSTIYKAADMLILNLDRQLHPFPTKNRAKVSIPEKLTINEETYQTKAVVKHLGETMENGHYVAEAKGKNGNWYHFDDLKPKVTTSPNWQADSAKDACLIFLERVKK